MFSILILAYNESENFAECLSHLKWCDDVVVIDSFSSDDTVKIAKAHGARVVQRAFDDFAGQRNYGIDTTSFKYDWIFHLDVDEHFTSNLREECIRVINKNEHGAFLVPSKMIFWGEWLKRSATYPVYQMRFHKLGDARFVQVGHGQRESGLKRGLGIMREPYEHHFFQKGLSDWLRKHIRYACDEAKQTQSNTESILSLLKIFIISRGATQRRALKKLFMRMPLRSGIKFTFVYLFRGGFLEGKAGLQYCRMLALYERMIALQIKELGKDSND